MDINEKDDKGNSDNQRDYSSDSQNLYREGTMHVMACLARE